MCPAFDGEAFIRDFIARNPIVYPAPKDPAPKDPAPKDPAPKGKTFEKIGEVLDSGRPAWRKVPKSSHLDKMQKEIEAENSKTVAPRVNRAKGSFLESHKQKSGIQGEVAEKPEVTAHSLARARIKKSIPRTEPPVATKAGVSLNLDVFKGSLKRAIFTLHEDHEYFTKASCPLPA